MGHGNLVSNNSWFFFYSDLFSFLVTCIKWFSLCFLLCSMIYFMISLRSPFCFILRTLQSLRCRHIFRHRKLVTLMTLESKLWLPFFRCTPIRQPIVSISRSINWTSKIPLYFATVPMFSQGQELQQGTSKLNTPLDKFNVHIRAGHVIPWQEPDVTTASR